MHKERPFKGTKEILSIGVCKEKTDALMNEYQNSLEKMSNAFMATAACDDFLRIENGGIRYRY